MLLVAARHVPESRDPQAARGFDVVGAAVGALGLGATTYALIEAGTAPRPYVVTAAVVGAVALVLFVVLERRERNPMVPMHLFASRTFSVANLLTLLVYGALGTLMFFLVLQLQVVSGWSPLAAGLSTVPLTLLMLLLSGRAGALAARIGPRVPLSVGPLLCGAGVLLLREIDQDAGYWLGVLPGMLVFSSGLVLLVAPLTSSVLAAAPDRFAGIASGINNAVARTGSLLAVSALPALVGIGGADYERPAVFNAGFEQAMLVSGAAVRRRAGRAVGLHRAAGQRDAVSRLTVVFPDLLLLTSTERLATVLVKKDRQALE